MKQLLAKCDVLGKGDIEASRKIRSGEAFIGILKKHENDKLFNLVISEKGEPLTALEFPLAGAVDFEDLGNGKVRVWMESGTDYIQKTYLTVAKGPRAEVPGIMTVFAGQSTGDPSARCSCDCECDCHGDGYTKSGARNDKDCHSFYSRTVKPK